jgi:aspartyl-tRNA synthetase
MFRTIFDGLERDFAAELRVVREQYPSEPVQFTEQPLVIHWEEGMELLRSAGCTDQGPWDDLSSANELLLGQVVKEKYGSDFFIMDRYPSDIRPFYTMPSPDDARHSNSYDIFIRGQEICSGAQRCHDSGMLEARIAVRTLQFLSSRALVAYVTHTRIT